MLRILEFEQLPDGRSRLDTVGERRFKVLEWGTKDGYSTARIEWVEDLPVEGGAEGSSEGSAERSAERGAERGAEEGGANECANEEASSANKGNGAGAGDGDRDGNVDVDVDVDVGVDMDDKTSGGGGEAAGGGGVLSASVTEAETKTETQTETETETKALVARMRVVANEKFNVPQVLSGMGQIPENDSEFVFWLFSLFANIGGNQDIIYGLLFGDHEDNAAGVDGTGADGEGGPRPGLRESHAKRTKFIWERMFKGLLG
jgi:hypothetical protein